MRAPGQVLNRADHILPRRRYDKVIVGGGLLGLACAFFLRRALPFETLLVAEASGVPSEAGATHVAPALVHSAFEDEALRRRAVWAARFLQDLERETGASQGASLRAVGWARLGSEETVPGLTTLPIGAWLAALPTAARANLERLLALDGVSHALHDPDGGYASAEATALALGRGAVKLGADLLIGGRAALLGDGEVALERLEFTRAMQLEVRRRERLSAGTVIVAAGAETAALVRAGLGLRLPWGRRYRQFPRLEGGASLELQEGRVVLPVVERSGFSLRPQGEGVLVAPPASPADPDGYVPAGGKLAGVPVGVRQELVEALLEELETLPFLAWETMNLGKSLRGVRGAWEAVTPSGLPESKELASGLYALAGGGFTLGLAEARELAGRLAGEEARPWGS